jgi:uncharacterized LabA/DUF88 family protein
MDTPNACAPRTLRSAVFIDGAHLSKTLRHAYPDVGRIGYDKLAALVAGPTELLRTYYYNALPYVSHQPTDEELERASKRRRFHDALRHLPNVTVREGRCSRTWSADRQAYVYKQKYVDVSLCADLVRLASKNRIDVAVLVAGDSDFIPAVEVAKDEGVQVKLLCSPNPREVHADLVAIVDQRMTLDAAMIDAVRLERAA